MANCGRPFEYFSANAADGITCLPRTGGNFPEDLRKTLAAGTTPNGVFGVKTHWRGFCRFVDRVKQTEPYDRLDAAEALRRLFPNVRYVRLRRKETLRQTVSLAIAKQTRVWAVPMTSSRAKKENLKYDYFELCALRDSIVQDEAAWEDYFLKHSIDPLEIFYEDMLSNYEGTLRRVLDHLQIETLPGQPFPAPPLQRLSDEVNDRWYRRYQRTPAFIGGLYTGCRSLWKTFKPSFSKVR